MAKLLTVDDLLRIAKALDLHISYTSGEPKEIVRLTTPAQFQAFVDKVNVFFGVVSEHKGASDSLDKWSDILKRYTDDQKIKLLANVDVVRERAKELAFDLDVSIDDCIQQACDDFLGIKREDGTQEKKAE